MTGRLSHFMERMKTQIFEKWYLRALLYGLILAAIFVTWLFLDGDSVAFVYSEF